ncbi:MAG: tetratricopeptide repeat protein [Candidatus Hydrogenedentes bacterium]|nr:tetratricopeptide repeat protein [Candidatus Hydrogenedentota bacterium]
MPDWLGMVGFDLTWVLSGLFLIPYLLWGIYLLRQQLVHDVELDRAVETFTFVFLVLFFIFEFTLIKIWLDDSPVALVFATLALVISAFALYGPLLMSFGSHLLVDLLMPAGKHHDDVPRYGSAESFETRGDYEGAAREYISIARQFPEERRAALSAADNLAKIGQAQVAAPWFESALELTKDADEALRIVNRLSDIYVDELNQPQEAREVLEEFIERFPESEYADSVRRRIDRPAEESSIPSARRIGDTLPG